MGFYKKEVTADVRLDVRVNAAEKAEIKERASRACLSVSDYVRRCALGKRVDMRYDVDAILASLRHATRSPSCWPCLKSRSNPLKQSRLLRI